jgi:hypothetical protein
MNKALVLIVITSSLIAVPAKAEMPISSFLAKADALKKRGFFAMGSPDIKLLRNEVVNAAAAFDAEIAAARKAGRVPPACVPPKTKLNSEEMMTFFRTIPAAQAQTMTVKTGFYALMKKRYPCRP